MSDSLRDALLGVLRDHRFLNGHPMDERKAMVDDLVAVALAAHPVEPAGVSDEAAPNFISAEQQKRLDWYAQSGVGVSDEAASDLAYEYQVRSPKEPYFGIDFNSGWDANREEASLYLRDEHGYEVRRRKVTGWEAVTGEATKP